MEIWVFIADALIIGGSACLANSETIFSILANNGVSLSQTAISTIQEISAIISAVYGSLFVAGRLLYSKKKRKADQCRIANLYNMVKRFLQSNFEKITKNGDFSFEMRIFVPEKRRLRKKEKWFVIRNTYPFAKRDITESLRFRVDPDPQGLVGKCYTDKAIFYDDKLLLNNTNYSLNPTQALKTDGLKWSICVPIINYDDEVIAVVAFDSLVSHLNISEDADSIRSLTNTFSQMLYDCAPELFK